MKNPFPLRITLLIGAFFLTSASAEAQSSSGPAAGHEPTLAEVKQATSRFQDVEVALKEGYIADPMNLCDTADMMGRPASDGAMGIHFFRPDLLAITATEPRVNGVGVHTDFLNPAILIYEPQADGTLELVAVENLVFKASWDSLGAEPPSFLGVPYDLMADDASTEIDEAHMFEPHYDRHVWIYRENPNGVFAQFNPDVSCAYHTNASPHQHE